MRLPTGHERQATSYVSYARLRRFDFSVVPADFTLKNWRCEKKCAREGGAGTGGAEAIEILPPPPLGLPVLG